MYSIRVETDESACKRLWEEAIPKVLLSDLWEVRDCFHRSYRHAPYFIVAERAGKVVGLLPLSWNGETGQYTYFPGETWEGKTWLEQNRILATDGRMLREMLRMIPERYHLRYLQPLEMTFGSEREIDEVGYLFFPAKWDYNMDQYFLQFSHKTAKRLKKELAEWESRGLEYRYNHLSDLEILFEMNLSRYGVTSYFSDPRFIESFRNLTALLEERGWLRITTALVDGVPAAVDLGSVYNNSYTLLGGGTSADFPGIAKLINVHHMTWSCQQKIEDVDFLCGDFNWKTLFHLTPRPLYVLTNSVEIDRRLGIHPSLATPKATAHDLVQGTAHA